MKRKYIQIQQLLATLLIDYYPNMVAIGDQPARTALILYGSETGNAQDVANELGRLTERLHFLTRVSDLDSIDMVSFDSSEQYRMNDC